MGYSSIFLAIHFSLFLSHSLVFLMKRKLDRDFRVSRVGAWFPPANTDELVEKSPISVSG